MAKIEYGEFCRIFGKTARNSIMEFVLSMGGLDFAASDIVEQTNVSKPKAYDIIQDLEKEKILLKSRIVAGTQLYILNEKKPEVKILLRAINACVKLVIDEYTEKNKENSKPIIRTASKKAVAAKRV